MRTKSKCGWQTKITIMAFDANGKVIDRQVIHNEIKNVALNMVRNALRGTVTDLKIKYIAWGSDATANAKAQPTLVDEFGRKAITTQTAGGTGVVTSTTYIAPAEAISEKIEELGWFAGADATPATDRGILVGRVLYSRQKTNLESLQIEREDAIAEA